MRNWHVLKIRGAIDRFDEKKELLENLESFFDSLNDTRDRIDNPASNLAVSHLRGHRRHGSSSPLVGEIQIYPV